MILNSQSFPANDWLPSSRRVPSFPHTPKPKNGSHGEKSSETKLGNLFKIYKANLFRSGENLYFFVIYLGKYPDIPTNPTFLSGCRDVGTPGFPFQILTLPNNSGRVAGFPLKSLLQKWVYCQSAEPTSSWPIRIYSSISPPKLK